MDNKYEKRIVTTAIYAGDAVGVPQMNWYIAIVNNNTERKCGERLAQLGYEAYVPTQRQIRRRSNGRHSIIDRVVLPSLVFIRVSESERKAVVNLPFINRFMTNKANGVDGFNRHPIATIPDAQINMLKFMLYHSDETVEIVDRCFHVGEEVRIARGSMCGLQGYILDQDDKCYIVVGLDILGYAKVKININDIEHL